MGADGRFIPRERFVFVGRPNDIELAKLTLDFLSETLLHLAAAYVETEIERLSRRRGYDEERRVARGRAMRKAYLDGAAAAVAIRLTALFAERRDAGPDSVALVVRRETEIEDYLAHRHQGLGQSGELPSRPLRHEANRPLAGGTQNAAEAYDSGFSDGQGINLTPPHERLGEGDKITPQP
jgi:hypothetical protein